mgnify:CR=1 FL=1
MSKIFIHIGAREDSKGVKNKNMKIISKARIAHELSSVSIAVAEYLLDNYKILKDQLLMLERS